MNASVKPAARLAGPADQFELDLRRRRRFEMPWLFGILTLAFGLRLWGLEQNGWGADYYSAAVKSMSLNWHNFFFAAFDPTGFISVDKPPVALWLQVASVKLFGFHPAAVLLPQVLEGVAAVALLYHLVRRRFGAHAGLLAALLLAISPVWIAVNRTNNMDSCLLLALLLAAWPLMAAAEQGNRRLLLLSAALIGLAFNVKMLAAYIVLPTFFLIYFIGAPLTMRRRIADLAIAAAVVTATSLPWVLAVEFTPPEQRPYIGSSAKNSMFELLVGHNGIGRFVSRVARPDPAEPQPDAVSETPGSAAAPEQMSVPRQIVARLFVRAPTGPLRLFDGRLAAQASWLLPLALAALAVGAWRWRRRGGMTPSDLSLLFWLCWIGTYGVVYSYAGGIMHFYYLSTVAPALAALAAIGTIYLWSGYRQDGWRAAGLPVLLLATAGWQLYVHSHALDLSAGAANAVSPSWLNALKIALLAGMLASVAGLTLLRVAGKATSAAGSGAATLGMLALLVLPSAWALSSVLLPGHGVMPSADLYRLLADSQDANAIKYSRLGKTPEVTKLVGFLQSKRQGETYLLATSTTQLAAPIIIGSDEAVMARGGFHGLDSAVTPEFLQRMIATRQLRFVALGDVAAVSRKMGAERAGNAVSNWVRANGKPVPAALWRSSRSQRGIVLYDMRPENSEL